LTGKAARITERRGRIKTLEDLVPSQGAVEEVTPEAIEEAVEAEAAAKAEADTDVLAPDETVEAEGAAAPVTEEEAEAISEEIAEGGPVVEDEDQRSQ
jgi:hypothetical protein